MATNNSINNKSQDITLTGVSSPSYVNGKLVFDSDNRCLTFFNADSNVSMQIGKEGWVTVYNNSGSTIANGKPVYVSGYDATSGWLTIALADGSDSTKLPALGLTTESIANSTVGEVCFWGDVHGIDTSAMTAGATAYVGTTAGALTSTAPSAPNYRYRTGKVGKSDATTGWIQVTPSTGALGNGTANQVFGMNSAGTAQEVKSFSAPSTATIIHSANTISIGVGSMALAADASTTNTTATSTNLSFAIAANEAYDVMVTGTVIKAAVTSGLKVGLSGPAGATVRGYQLSGQAAGSTAMQNSYITSFALGVNFATGAGVEVPFQMHVHIKNSSTAGNVILQFASTSSGTATINAGTHMYYIRSQEV